MLLLFPHFSKAQEMSGVFWGNYSGATSMLINPAMMTNTHDFLSINLVSGDLFVQNNFAYIPAGDYSAWDAVKQRPLPEYGEKNDNFIYYDNNKLKDAVVNLRLMGPSAMIQLGDHAFGFSTGVRVFTSGNYLPWEMPVFGYESLKYDELHNIKFDDYNFDFQANVWGEFGLSYAYNLIKYFDQRLTVGISAKYLMGYSGMYTDVDNIEYIVQNDSIINLNNLNAEIGFALPIDYDNNDFPDSGPNIKGSGLGLDIGVVYIKRKFVDEKRWKKLCGQRYEEYKYRIGVSIVDIGRIKYKNNAQLHSFDNVSVLWENYDTTSFDNVNQLMGDFSNLVYGDKDASLKETSMKIGLPTALSVQADFNIRKNIFLGAFWIHPLRLNAHTMRRPAQLALIPRIETREIEFALPLTLYQYNDFRMGASLRLFFFTVGTDNIGTWLGTSNLDGLDVYFSVKFGLGKGSCKPKNPTECSNYEYGYSDKTKRLFKKR